MEQWICIASTQVVQTRGASRNCKLFYQKAG